VLALQQLHAIAAATKVNGADLVAIATSANRYLGEETAAKAWVDAYDPMIAAHADAQEEYEHAQLAAELGVVIASIALLLRRKLAWAVAIALGIAAIALVARTYAHARHEVHAAEAKIDDGEKAYRALRGAGRTTDADQALVDEVLKTYGAATPAPAPAPK
jgi:hypothetical protein